MSGVCNFYVDAGKALMTALDAFERETDPARLLAGSDAEVAERWACSAVRLKAGAGWLVVPAVDPVQASAAGRRVRAFEGGKYTGRTKYYDLAWLQEHADAVSLGVLTLSEGAGANAKFAGGSEGDTTLVAAGDSSDGFYYVQVAVGGAEEKSELGTALVQVGAVMTPMRAVEAAADEEEATVRLKGEGPTVAKARVVVGYLGELGCATADAFSVAVDAAELAGALCMAVDKEERRDAAAALLRRCRRSCRTQSRSPPCRQQDVEHCSQRARTP